MNRTLKCLAIFLAMSMIGISFAAVSQGQEGLSTSEQDELVKRFAPILYLHPEDDFYPISPEYAIARSDLKRVGNGLVSSSPTEAQLSQFTDPNAGYYLDNRMGTIYDYGIQDDFLESADDYPPKVYVRITEQRYEGENVYSIQYYFFYAFNRGPHNVHEGDWEMIMVVCDMSWEPIFAAYSQHLGGEFAEWELVNTVDTNPKVYVALGSHANYFRAYEGSIGFANDVCSSSGRVLSPGDYDIEILENQGWLAFAGNWGDYGGVSAGILGERGPMGPAYQAERWNNPIGWAQGLNKVGEGWFMLNWTVANMVWMILGIMALVLLIVIFTVYRRKKKQGTLGPRWSPFLYIKGIDKRSLASILAITALLIGIIGYFMPWYSISINVETGEYSTPGAIEILRMDGLNGLSFNRLEPGAGLVQVMGLPIPFAWLMLFSVVIFLISTIGIQKCRKFGFKLAIRGVNVLVPAILLIFLVSIMGSFISGYVMDAPPEVNEIINTVSASPIKGSTSEAFGDYGTATLTWGIGSGVVMFILSAILFFISAAMLIFDKGVYFEAGEAAAPVQYQPQPYEQQPAYAPTQEYYPPPPVQQAVPGQPVIITCPGCGNTASVNPGAPAFQCMRCGGWMYPPPPSN